MKIVIISDIHANIAALRAVGESEAGQGYDLLVFLGDAVDYGPSPVPCLEWLRTHAHVAIRGNHDHAVAFRTDCHSAPHRHHLSVATRKLMWQLLEENHPAWLRSLPMTASFAFAGARFFCCHAAPSDNLFKYLRPDVEEELKREVEKVDTDFILTGHTHLPVVREIGRKTIINPGSVGQPTDGDPRTSFAVWENGAVKLHRVEYSVDETIAGLVESPLDSHVKSELISILREGR